MKYNIMGWILAIIMAVVNSVSLKAQTEETTPTVKHINSLSEIKDLNAGDVILIDKLYRVGLFGTDVFVTDEENELFVKMHCKIDWNNKNYVEFNKFHDDYSSSNQDYYDVLYNLQCEVYESDGVQYVGPELRLTLEAESTINGGKLSNTEKQYIQPVIVDQNILKTTGKELIKEYQNKVFRFTGKITELKSPCKVENCDYEVYGPPISGDNHVTQNVNYLYLGIFDYKSDKICVNVEKKLIKRIYTTQKITWDFAAMPNVQEWGTVEVSMTPGDGVINDGEKATLTAAANPGYKFVRWTLNGKEVSTAATFTTPEVYCNIGYVAVFAKEDEGAEEYEVTVTADNEDLGRVSVSSSRAVSGAEVTATATPNDGARFSGWYNGDEKVSDESTYTFPVTGDISLTAHFVKTHIVTFGQPEGGTIAIKCGDRTLVSGDAVDDGSTVTITATPAPNYALQSIKVDGVAQSFDGNSAIFTVTGDIMISVEFAEKPILVQSISELLESDGANGSLVRFDIPLTVVAVMNGVDAVVTDGERLLFLFNQSGLTGGQWKPAVNEVLTGVEGRYKVISYERSNTYKFAKIELTTIPQNSEAAPRQSPVTEATFDNVFGDYNNWGNKLLHLNAVNIYFGIVNPTKLHLSVRPTADQESDLPLVLLSNENQDIENTGQIYGNANWSKSLDVTGFIHEVEGKPGFHIMKHSLASGATEESRYLINLVASPADGGTVWIDNDPNAVQKSCGAGDKVMIHASAAEGYKFKEWRQGDDVYSTEPSVEYTVAGNASLTAVFVKNQEEKPVEPAKEQYKVTLRNGGNGSMTVAGPEGATVTDGQTVEEGTLLTVVLTADAMYLPSQLLVNGMPVGKESDGTYRVTIVGETVIASSFVPDAVGVYHLKIASRGPEGYNGGKVYIDAEGTTAVEAHYGEKHTFFAEAADGFTFVRWVYEGETSGPGTSSRFEWAGQGNLSLVAVFDHAIGTERTITVWANDASKGRAVIVGEPDGTQSVTTRAVVRLRAVPATEYDRFVRWTVNGEVRDDAEIEIKNDGDADCVAYFASDYPVIFSAEGHGELICRLDGNEIESGRVVADGAAISIRAVADVHNHLATLTFNGKDILEQYLANPGAMMLSVNEPAEIKALFAIDRHRLLIGRHLHGHLEVFRTLSPNGSGAGDKVESEMYHDYGSMLYVFAVPDEGYQLKGITLNGRSMDTGAGYGTVTIDGDMTLACDFEEKPSGLTMPNADEEGSSADEWYDLSGRRVTRDALRSGNIYILRSNGISKKVMITHSR